MKNASLHERKAKLLEILSDLKLREESDGVSLNGKYLLAKSTSDNDYRYFIGQNSKKVVYIPSSRISLAKSLAHNAYVRTARRAALKELRAIEFNLRHSSTFEDAISDFFLKHPGYAPLLRPDFSGENSAAREFLEKYETDPDYKPEGRYVLSNGGYKVRSKSEAQIVNALIDGGLIFVYEPKIFINGQVFHPDFVIFDRSTGNIIIWEHFGRMDDLRYAQQSYSKLNMYAASGFFVDSNLIITTETQFHPLTDAEIQSKIHKLLL